MHARPNATGEEEDENKLCANNFFWLASPALSSELIFRKHIAEGMVHRLSPT